MEGGGRNAGSVKKVEVKKMFLTRIFLTVMGARNTRLVAWPSRFANAPINKLTSGGDRGIQAT